MDLVINPSREVSGKVVAPPSKFYTQFALVLALLAEGKSVIKYPLSVDDTRILLRTVEQMGATVKRGSDQWAIWGVGSSPRPEGNVVDVKNSLPALSFIVPAVALARRAMVVTGDPGLRSLPMPSLLRALREFGAEIYSTKPNDAPPFVFFGGGELRGKKISIRGKEDLFHVPSLLLLAPYAKGRTVIEFPPKFAHPQLEMAVELLRVAKAKLRISGSSVMIEEGACKPFEVRVPPDLAGCIPYITAAVLTGSELRIPRTKDTRSMLLVELLRDLGADIRVTPKSIHVRDSDDLVGFNVDLSWMPELLPFVAALACRAKGKTTISNVAGAVGMRKKIEATVEGLRQMGVKATELGDGVVIEGPARIKSCTVDGRGDCEAVAAFAVLGLVSDRGIRIKNRAEALRATYPRFVSTFRDLGAEIGYAR